MSNKKESVEQFLGSYSPDKLTTWLLNGFVTQSFDGIRIELDPSLALQLRNIYTGFSPQFQSRFKEGVIRSLFEWDLHTHGPQCLKGLAFLGAYIRALGCIEPIRFILESEILESLKETSTEAEDVYKETLQVLLGVVQGFAPYEGVKIVFERLYFSESFDYRFAAQLFLGLCECSPEQYPRYLPRFLDLQKKYPAYYALEFVVSEMERIVTLARTAANLRWLEPRYQERLLENLCTHKWSPASLVGESFDTLALTLRKSVAIPSQTFGVPIDRGMFIKIRVKEIRNDEGPVRFAENALLKMAGIRQSFMDKVVTETK